MECRYDNHRQYLLFLFNLRQAGRNLYTLTHAKPRGFFQFIYLPPYESFLLF